MQSYYGSGKLLLSGEYYVLDGASALALPTKLGQFLRVSYAPSEHRVLHWKSYDSNGEMWLEAKFDVETFECLDQYVSQKSLILQKILRMARRLSKGFLTGKEYILVETFLEFPTWWGLGSSSTLIHNIAKWAGINPYELLFKTIGGSGYDVACAESNTAIVYEKQGQMPHKQEVEFNPPFKNCLYFVYLGKKQSSKEGIDYYQSLNQQKDQFVMQLSEITKKILEVQELSQFDQLIREHELLISQSLKMQRVKDLYFSDFWGEVKSLGAWGGDFVLVTSEKSEQETKTYFASRGFDVFVPYQEMVK